MNTVQSPKIVLAFGTFDILHPGHLSYLMQARRRGDRLIVVIARDETVRSLKKHPPVFTQKERLTLVSALHIVSEAILGNKGDHIRIVEKIRPHVICIGYDQRVSIDALHKILTQRNLSHIQIVRAKPYRKNQYKSSHYRCL
ncbi:FAD synthase [Candidatus Uhrbacteria bacterium]|nr:FAD synthase [Candidatus Uhrbacteria bacterium]